MFNYFKNKKTTCPIDEETRVWIEYAMQWLKVEFGEEFFQETYVYSNLKELLNDFEKENANLKDLGEIISYIMFLENDNISFSVYSEGQDSIKTKAGETQIETYEDELTSGGMFVGKDENGVYNIGIERKLLNDPIHLTSTISHELSHIWLLEKKGMKENDEYLTDILPIIFGLGVFGANSCFSFEQTTEGWSSKSKGYLNQMEWGYALAVYNWLRNDKNPEWIKSLPRNIQSDYKKSLNFMENNQDKLFEQKIEI